MKRGTAMLAVMVLLLVAFNIGAAAEREPQKQTRFPSAEEAVKALIDAARADDATALIRILGPERKNVVLSGDPTSDKRARETFVKAHDEKAQLRAGASEAWLAVGTDEWQFPIPVVKDATGWRFDAKKGTAEILRRRIGRNELNVIQVCLAYVDAQREYAAKDRDADGIPAYAQRIASDSGKRNGLYWEASAGEEASPLGPMVARARSEGYTKGTGDGPAPYHGYLFRILTAQGSHAKGGAFSYVAGRRMIGGFALIAYPAAYGTSGVMTFIVNHDGVVHQKDLGPSTATISRRIMAYDPDESWKPVQ